MASDTVGYSKNYIDRFYLAYGSIYRFPKALNGFLHLLWNVLEIQVLFDKGHFGI